MVTVVCYNRKETWDSRDNAIKFYHTGTLCCYSYSSEWRRYYMIMSQLIKGYNYCCDNAYSETQAKDICDSCTEMNPKNEDERMASLLN